MRIAVVGCVHGELNHVYASLQRAPLPDLVILCGDVQACRDAKDLDSMSVPVKYRRLGDFPEYFKGSRVAPVLTIVVGGNHEASAYMSTLSKGGWLAPNIWYIGDAGVIKVGGIRLAGLSGIWYGPDYDKPRFEHSQFRRWTGPGSVPADSIFSVYHVRRADVKKLTLLKERPDIFVSHDWPRGVEQSGDTAALLREKPWFRRDVAAGVLGSPAGRQLLDTLKPKYWLAAHLHCHFEADHQGTHFLALDKVLPRRYWLEYIEVGPPVESGSLKIEIDPAWQALTTNNDSP